MKKLFALSLLVAALASANLRAETNYGPTEAVDAEYGPANPEYGPTTPEFRPTEKANFCDSARSQGALKVIKSCKDREDWAACVVGQEDANERLAYLQVCDIPEAKGFQAYNPCECLAKIHERHSECGSEISCDTKEQEAPQADPPPPPPSTSDKEQNPTTGANPAISGSGCSLAGLGAGANEMGWLLGLAFAGTTIFRRRR